MDILPLDEFSPYTTNNIIFSPYSYQQACSSVQIGLRKLEELGVPTRRPEDYFAEMVKTDDHMRKVN